MIVPSSLRQPLKILSLHYTTFSPTRQYQYFVSSFFFFFFHNTSVVSFSRIASKRLSRYLLDLPSIRRCSVYRNQLVLNTIESVEFRCWSISTWHRHVNTCTNTFQIDYSMELSVHVPAGDNNNRQLGQFIN